MALQISLIIIGLFALVAATCSYLIWQKLNRPAQDEQFKAIEGLVRQLHQELRDTMIDRFSKNQLDQEKSLSTFREKFDERQMDTLKILTDTLKNNLDQISGKVEERLNEGFKKTTETFTDVIKRLALIDEAQKKITELSSNVVSLQEVLQDKRSRGAFGEVQLTALIRNVMPEQTFSFQYRLSNDKRADCMLFLPEPTGNIAIDAKFPLESYQQLTNPKLSDIERKTYEQTFRQNIKKHIQDIATKYIIPGETSDGAVMFIPAEAVFSEIHAHYPELVEEAQRSKVWLVSPTTMMAVLTTARAVLKDAATRKHVHIIQEHLSKLAKDFGRFEDRMNKLAKHIGLAHQDVEEVNKSSRKITSRFNKIEKVELTDQPDTKEAVELLSDIEQQ